MDDDGIPAPDCLDKLLSTGRLGFHYVAPNLIDENGASHFDAISKRRVLGLWDLVEDRSTPSC